MRFLVIDSFPDAPDAREEDTVVLVKSEWDDYGFRTKFEAYLAPAGGEYRRLGMVKILAGDYNGGEGEFEYKRTYEQLPAQFAVLEENFCSMGQEFDYYRRLGETPVLGQKVLSALRDVVICGIEDEWEEVDGVNHSLFRTKSAQHLRFQAEAIFQQKEVHDSIQSGIDFRPASYRAEGLERFRVHYDGGLDVPGRLNVVVGKNGSGKTSLLAAIARWFDSYPYRGWEDGRPNLSRVLVVSYNAYDSAFRSPDEETENVVYLGRQPLEPDEKKAIKRAKDSSSLRLDPEELHALAASPEDFVEELNKWNEFTDALTSALTKLTTVSFSEETLFALQADEEWAQFINYGFDDDSLRRKVLKADSMDFLEELSAGQRVLLQLYAALFKHLDQKALVLVDEPENHLHPSLIARFVKSFNRMLEQRRAFGLIATHSPVILQETPSQFVHVLMRQDEGPTEVVPPPFETFGESIDNLTEILFETDFTASHWKHVLRRLAVDEKLSNESIVEKVGGKPLPLQARTYVSGLRLQAGENLEAGDD